MTATLTPAELSDSDRALIRALKRYAKAHGIKSGSVTIAVEGLEPLQLDIGAVAPRPMTPAAECALEVVNALDAGEYLPGHEIAVRAGYRHGGWFSGLLAKLARDGHMVVDRRNGYGPAPSPTAATSDSLPAKESKP